MTLFSTFKKSAVFFRTSEFDRLRLRYASLPRYTPTRLVFRAFTFDVLDAASVIWQIKETFFDEHLKFKSDSPTPVIIDCGSNVGVTATYFSKLFPNADIIAFEADPATAEVLKKNLQANGIKNVQVIEKAVWTDNRGVAFAPDHADGGSIYSSGEKINVPSLRIKDFIQERRQVDMLKIDIEGAETAVIADCAEALQKIHYIMLEYHSWKNRPQDLDVILNTLTKNNFRYYMAGVPGNKNPFTTKAKGPMDFQTNIYAINTAFRTE